MSKCVPFLQWLLLCDFLLAQQTLLPPDVDQCSEELTLDASGNQVSWPNVNITDNIISSPLCLDDEHLLIARNCTDAGWTPLESPACSFSQNSYEMSNKCPLGYLQLATNNNGNRPLCILLTEPQPWNNTCLVAGTDETFLDLSDSDQALVIDYLLERDVTRVWMPATRFIDFGPIAWQLPGYHYGESVEFEDDIELETSDGIEERGCLSLNITNRGRSGGDEDCMQSYPILCVYNEHRPLLQLACPDGMLTSRYEGHQNVCFSAKRIRGIGSEVRTTSTTERQLEFNWVESECRGEIYSLDSVEKTVLFESLAERSDLREYDRCLFGVLPGLLIDSQLDWTVLSVFTKYVNWAEPGQPVGNIVTTDRHGKWHWTDDFTCITCQSPVAAHVPHINLKFFDEHLYAVVYNNEYFWREDRDESGFKCFTDSDYELIRSVKVEGQVWNGVMDDDNQVPVELRDKTRTVYRLKTYGDGPGYYWCSGHAIPNFQRIDSPPVVAYKKIKGEVFAVMVQTDCQDCRNYFQNKYIKEIAKRFKDQLNDIRKVLHRQTAGNPIEEISIENVRVMKICGIDVEKNESKILFHVTVTLDHFAYSSDKDQLDLPEEIMMLYTMRNRLVRMLESNASSNVTNSTMEFKYLWLNNTEYCLPEEDQLSNSFSLNWGSAKIGEMTAPRELCLLSNGLPARRKCVGDFIYGGAWSSVNANVECNQKNISPITQSLYDIDRLYTSIEATSEVIQNISRLIQSANNTELIPADLYYLGRVMHSITKFNELANSQTNNNQSNSLSSNNNNTFTTAILSTSSSSVAASASTTSNSTTTTTTTNTNTTSTDSKTSSSSSSFSTTLLQRVESENIFAIYNRLMFLNEHTTKLAAALNATNVLLEALDHIVNGMSADNLLMMRTTVNLTENTDDGTIAMISPKLLVYVIDPAVHNVSGLALRRRPTQTDGSVEIVTDDFLSYDVQLLYANQSAGDLLLDEALEIASFVPQRLLSRLKETWRLSVVDNITTPSQNTSDTGSPPPPVRIVVTIYYNDLLFQEYKNMTYAKPGGKIISVSIPGYGPILPDLLPIYVKTKQFDNTTDTRNVCGYWDFQLDTWSRDGCEYGGSSTGHTDSTVMCACSHLTHFAYLVMGTYFHSIPGEVDVVLVDQHQDALDLITLLGCCLSLAGIVGISVTAIVFPSWREKPGSKVLLHLSAAIALQMILLCFVNTEVRSMNFFLNQQWAGCVAMGALLHYSVLVAFMWMLITAYLQFMRYVRVIGPGRTNRFFLKATLFGWGIPTIPVSVILVLVPDSYIPNLDKMDQGICYPTGNSLYFGVIIPMGVIVLANLVIFLLVIYNILRGPDGKLRTSNDRDLTMSQLRLSIFLFFLLGLTWIFGLCATTQVGLVFSYLFCLTATLQGFVLFLYFIVLDPITRNLWGKWLKRYLSCSNNGEDFK